MNDLVRFLAEGTHPVVVGGSDQTPKDLQRRIEELQYVFVRFTDTRGGTELGIPVDNSATGLAGADFEQGSGTVHVEGNLTLDYVPVRCIADIDLATMTGIGHLEIR